ncbi:hypothetical protein [Brevibacillus sp. NRS-1366]|uniref:hypothetical protein n=1 Tax=Brevibacillus sp. NRS-1366 TaxID=3233899 RepID=UPI003D1D6D92
MNKWFKLFLFVPMLLLDLSGCMNQTDQNESVPPPDAPIVEAIEELTISFDSKQIKVSVDQIPSLREYLIQYDAAQRQEELERIVIRSFASETVGLFADISYSCGVKLCNHVLIQIKNDEIKTLPFGSSSIFQKALFSPDEKMLGIVLGRNEGTELVRNNLFVVDIKRLEAAKVACSSDVVNQLVEVDSFIWPIHLIQWLDNKTLEVTVPQLNDSSYDALVTWKKGNGAERALQVELESSD